MHFDVSQPPPGFGQPGEFKDPGPEKAIRHVSTTYANPVDREFS